MCSLRIAMHPSRVSAKAVIGNDGCRCSVITPEQLSVAVGAVIKPLNIVP
jgi:hypothetical protein